jgi:flagellar L-ring protein precursor FlgH
LNRGDEYIRLTGIIRKQDIKPNNTIDSARVADARITYSGSGEIASGSEQGWVTRLLNRGVVPN